MSLVDKSLNAIADSKIIAERQRMYLTILNTCILVSIYIDKFGIRWWYWLIIPVWIVFTWFDMKYILGREVDQRFKRSKSFQKLFRENGDG